MEAKLKVLEDKFDDMRVDYKLSLTQVEQRFTKKVDILGEMFDVGETAENSGKKNPLRELIGRVGVVEETVAKLSSATYTRGTLHPRTQQIGHHRSRSVDPLRPRELQARDPAEASNARPRNQRYEVSARRPIHRSSDVSPNAAPYSDGSACDVGAARSSAACPATPRVVGRPFSHERQSAQSRRPFIRA